MSTCGQCRAFLAPDEAALARWEAHRLRWMRAKKEAPCCPGACPCMFLPTNHQHHRWVVRATDPVCESPFRKIAAQKPDPLVQENLF